MAISAKAFYVPLQLLSLIFLSTCLLCSAFTLKDYPEALEKSILSFEGQRSGKLPQNQWVSGRGDSSLWDGLSASVLNLFTKFIFIVFREINVLSDFLALQVDLIGGYYDVGDFVKFGFPMAFIITLLASSAIEFGNSMQGHMKNAWTAVCWDTDYLLKSATATRSTLYVQVSYKVSHYNISRI